jgi:hypothetical protein
MVELDRQLITRNAFHNCISQDFGLPGSASAAALVSSNRVLFTKLKDQLKAMHKRVTTGLGETMEVYPRTALVSRAARMQAFGAARCRRG